MSTEIEILDQQILELRKKRNALEDKRYDEITVPYLKSLVGKTYAYRNNSYSCPEPGEYFDCFRRVLRAVHGKDASCLICVDVSTDYKGNSSARHTIDFPTNPDYKAFAGGGWEECPEKEFNEAWLKAMQQFNNPELATEYYLKH